jgi:uncharacterized protein
MIRLFSRPAALCLAAALLTTAAQAQQAPARSSPAQAGSAAPAAAEPTQSHLTLAREFAGLTGILGFADPIIPQFSAQVRQRTVTRPELTKDLDQVLDALKPEIEQQKQTVVDAIVRLYATAYSEAELKELIGFFKTPSGQKYLKATPQILDAMEREIRRWAERVSAQVMDRVRTEMAKRGHQI